MSSEVRGQTQRIQEHTCELIVLSRPNTVVHQRSQWLKDYGGASASKHSVALVIMQNVRLFSTHLVTLVIMQNVHLFSTPTCRAAEHARTIHAPRASVPARVGNALHLASECPYASKQRTTNLTKAAFESQL